MIAPAEMSCKKKTRGNEFLATRLACPLAELDEAEPLAVGAGAGGTGNPNERCIAQR